MCRAEHLNPQISILPISLQVAYSIHQQIPEFIHEGVISWDDFKKRIEGTSDLQMYAAYLGDKPVGYVLGYGREDLPGYYVDYAGVMVGFRRNGIHTQLMDYLENFGIENGYNSILLITWQKREVMQGWAQKNGYLLFREESREIFGENRLYYRKQIV